MPPAGNVGAGGLSNPAREFLRQYSAVVLDAGSTGLKPSLFPKLFDDSGVLLLDPRELAYADATRACAVQYVDTLDQVQARRDFGQPLVLRVRDVRGKLGRTENEVATHILVREVYAMYAAAFHELRIPPPEEDTK